MDIFNMCMFEVSKLQKFSKLKKMNMFLQFHLTTHLPPSSLDRVRVNYHVDPKNPSPLPVFSLKSLLFVDFVGNK